MSQPFRTIATVEVAEKSTCRITATLTDHSGATLAAVDTLQLTLYHKRTGAILNARDADDVLNANGGTFNAGAFGMTLGPDDNALEFQSLGAETHVAQIDWTYNSGTATGRHLVEFVVRNFLKVT